MKKIKITLPVHNRKHFEDALKQHGFNSYSMNIDGDNVEYQFQIQNISDLLVIGETFGKNQSRED